MTLFDKPNFSASPFLLAQPGAFGSNSIAHDTFGRVLAQPERHSLPGGELLVFRFGNGYGAAITRVNALPEGRAYEFCVLDCTAGESQPTFTTPVSAGLLAELDHATVARLLTQAEALPCHPQLMSADEVLTLETF